MERNVCYDEISPFTKESAEYLFSRPKREYPKGTNMRILNRIVREIHHKIFELKEPSKVYLSIEEFDNLCLDEIFSKQAVVKGLQDIRIYGLKIIVGKKGFKVI